MITNGTFKGKAVEAALCRANSGTEYIGLVMQVTEGPATGEKVSGKLFWTDKTKAQTKRELDCLGWQGEIGDECALVGLTKTVPFSVIEEEYQGRKTLKVDWIGVPRFDGIPEKDRLRLSEAKRMIADMRGGGGNGATPRTWDGQGADPADPPF